MTYKGISNQIHLELLWLRQTKHFKDRLLKAVARIGMANESAVGVRVGNT